MSISNDKITAISHKEYNVPSFGSYDLEIDLEIEHTLNKIVGHLRNIFYFCFGITIQWGYIGSYGSTKLDSNDGLFPSIHNNGRLSSDVTFSPDNATKSQEMLNDIKDNKTNELKTMLNYWRRAKELDDLGFGSEAFLNYFKVIECLSQINENNGAATAIKNRFATQKTLLKKYKFRNARQFCGDVTFIARALATANIDEKVTRGLFKKMLEIKHVRHGHNVAHKFLRSNPYDTYDAIGQHSDEFQLTMIENSNIETITKFLILNYIEPGKYPLGRIFVATKPT